MNTKYYKNKHLRLSQKCIDDYPSHFNQDHKHYEFLECVLYLNNNDSPRGYLGWGGNAWLVTEEYLCFKGRFMGISYDKYSGVTYFTMYRTSCDKLIKNFDLINRSGCSTLLDDRDKYNSSKFAIRPIGSCIYVNIYPIYQKELLLLYFHLLTQKTSLLPECLGVISDYLKPRSHHDYEIIWNNGLL